MNQRTTFKAEVGRLLSRSMKDRGFDEIKHGYRRVLRPVIHLVEFQTSTDGLRCCVNLGIHLEFLTSFGSDAAVDPSKFREIDCLFRKRLAPPGSSDQWWPFGDSEESAATLAEMVIQSGVPYLDTFKEFPDDFTKVRPWMLDSDAPLPFPTGGTLVQQLWAMGKIALAANNYTEAAQFAERGLAKADGAIALKSAFRQIITESQAHTAQ